MCPSVHGAAAASSSAPPPVPHPWSESPTGRCSHGLGAALELCHFLPGERSSQRCRGALEVPEHRQARCCQRTGLGPSGTGRGRPSNNPPSSQVPPSSPPLLCNSFGVGFPSWAGDSLTTSWWGSPCVEIPRLLPHLPHSPHQNPPFWWPGSPPAGWGRGKEGLRWSPVVSPCSQGWSLARRAFPAQTSSGWFAEHLLGPALKCPTLTLTLTLTLTHCLSMSLGFPEQLSYHSLLLAGSHLVSRQNL